MADLQFGITIAIALGAFSISIAINLAARSIVAALKNLPNSKGEKG